MHLSLKTYIVDTIDNNILTKNKAFLLGLHFLLTNWAARSRYLFYLVTPVLCR